MNYQYVIDVWDTTSVLRRCVERWAAWFPPWSRDPTPGRLTPPARPMPRVMGVYQDAERRLWVVGMVADRR